MTLSKDYIHYLAISCKSLEYLEAFTAVAVGDRIDVSYISACPNLQNIYCRFNISEIQSLPVSTLLVAFAGREAKGSFPYIREGVYTVSVTLLYSNGSVISGSTVQRQVEVVSGMAFCLHVLLMDFKH